jgi:hypothetical protein
MVDFRAEARRIAVENGVDPDLFERLVQAESSFNPAARSGVGAQGLAQLMPATARELGVDPSDPLQNLQGGARYLRQQIDRFGNVPMALAAYNAGPTRVARVGGVPNIPETQNYVNKIMGGGKIMGGSMGSGSMAGGAGEDGLMDGYMQDQQPRGLLASLGIQKRDPAAGGETALPFYQRGSFKDTIGNLAIGLNSLRLNPDENLAASVQGKMQQRQDTAMANRTAQFLSQQPNGQMYVQMIQSGASPASVLSQYQSDMRAAQAANAPKPIEYKEVNGKIVAIDPNTGTATDIYGSGSLTPDQISTSGALRDDLRNELGSFNLVRSGYQTIQDLYANSGSVSDYALAVGFAKILDPTSVAREGEVAAIAGATDLPSTLQAQLTNALNGTGSLPPQVREDIANIASRRYAREAERAKATLDRYKFAAEQANVPFEQVWLGGDIAPAATVQPQGAPRLTTGSIQVGSQTFTQAQLDAAWPNMSPAARQAVASQIGAQP